MSNLIFPVILYRLGEGENYMKLRYAYNTNGLQSHRLHQALIMMAENGYQGVALTLDHMHLDPLYAQKSEIRQVKQWLNDLQLNVVIETGARFVLDPLRKHQPNLATLESSERMRRVQLLKRSIEIAVELEADLVNFATGPRDSIRSEYDAWPLLEESIGDIVEYANQMGMPLSLEPEPEHWIQTLAAYEELNATFPSLSLTLDVSHISVCEDEGTAQAAIAKYQHHLALVHLEDAPFGVHAHLPFGEGELDLPAIITQLHQINFTGLCAIELSRHSHTAHQLLTSSIETLQTIERSIEA